MNTAADRTSVRGKSLYVWGVLYSRETYSAVVSTPVGGGGSHA